MAKEKNIIIIAGPNGAGKTTFAKEFLPNEAGCPIFVNADLIAAGLSPFFPEQVASVREVWCMKKLKRTCFAVIALPLKQHLAVKYMHK